MDLCYIALGSNLDQPLAQVTLALKEIAELPETTLQAASPWYQSVAIGPGQQPDYLNGVAEIKSALAPLELLSALQHIEQLHRRQRLQRWGPRTLDLDILLYGDQRIDLPQLQIPHPRMLERSFVVYPLYDLAPLLQLPDGTPLKHHRQSLSHKGLRLATLTPSPTITATKTSGV